MPNDNFYRHDTSRPREELSPPGATFLILACLSAGFVLSVIVGVLGCL